MDRNSFKLGDAIGAFLKGHQLEERFYEAILKADWREIMGDNIADKTNDLSLEKGCLILYLSSAPLRQQMRLKQSKMINYINQKIGRGGRPVRQVLIR